MNFPKCYLEIMLYFCALFGAVTRKAPDYVMDRLFMMFLLAAFAMSSCVGGRNGSDAGLQEDTLLVADSLPADTFVIGVEENPIPERADEFFDDFFFNFIENERFQKSRVCFPLNVYAEGVPVDTIRKADWLHEAFFSVDENYTLILDRESQLEQMKDCMVDSVVVEQIMLNASTVKQFVFKRRNGEWRMMRIDNTSFANHRNASFLRFYPQFAADSAFQMRHIANPVHFSAPDPDDDFGRMEGVITPDSWFAFAPEFPRDVIYNVVYGWGDVKSNYRLFVIRGISNGEETHLKFVRRDRSWTLVRLDT